MKNKRNKPFVGKVTEASLVVRLATIEAQLAELQSVLRVMRNQTIEIARREAISWSRYVPPRETAKGRM